MVVYIIPSYGLNLLYFFLRAFLTPTRIIHLFKQKLWPNMRQTCEWKHIFGQWPIQFLLRGNRSKKSTCPLFQYSNSDLYITQPVQFFGVRDSLPFAFSPFYIMFYPPKKPSSSQGFCKVSFLLGQETSGQLPAVSFWGQVTGLWFLSLDLLGCPWYLP